MKENNFDKAEKAFLLTRPLALACSCGHGFRSFYASAAPFVIGTRRAGIFNRQMAMITIETKAQKLLPLRTLVSIVIAFTRTDKLLQKVKQLRWQMR